MNLIFYGLLLVFLDFDINIGRCLIGFLPDFIGYILIFRGIAQLSDESLFFVKVRPFTAGMSVYSFILYVLLLSGIMNRSQWYVTAMDIIGTAALLLISYCIVKGINEMERSYSTDLNGGALMSAWILSAAVQLALYVLKAIPSFTVTLLIIAAVAAIAFLYELYKSRELYNVINKLVVRMREGFSFRMATEEDADSVLELYHSLIGTEGCTWDDGYPTIDDVNQDIAAHSLYCCIEDMDNSLAAAAFAGKCDELDHLHWNGSIHNPCDLARIGVRRNLQNQGIGSLLLQTIFADVKERGYDGIRMLVSKTNPAAIALYKRNGFNRVGETFMYDIDFYCYERSI